MSCGPRTRMCLANVYGIFRFLGSTNRKDNEKTSHLQIFKEVNCFWTKLCHTITLFCELVSKYKQERVQNWNDFESPPAITEICEYDYTFPSESYSDFSSSSSSSSFWPEWGWKVDFAVVALLSEADKLTLWDGKAREREGREEEGQNMLMSFPNLYLTQVLFWTHEWFY